MTSTAKAQRAWPAAALDLRRTAWPVGCVLVLVACGAGQRPPLIGHPAKLAWPAEQPRIHYVGQIRGAADAGGTVARVLAGAAAPQRLLRPYAITQTSDGVLVVTDPGARRVHLFDLARRRHRLLTHFHGKALQSPVGAASDARRRFYISDSEAKRIYVFDSQGRALSSFGGALKRPTGIAIDRARNVLYVADTTSHRIHARSLSTGRYLFGVGRRGSAPAQFNYPTHLFFSDKRSELFVCDTLNYRVQRLDRRGRHLKSLGRIGDTSGSFARPKGLAVDSQGNLYVADALFDRIQVFDLEGRLLLYFGRPGNGHGDLTMPTGVYIEQQDRIFVANTLNRRVEIYRYDAVGRHDQKARPASPAREK